MTSIKNPITFYFIPMLFILATLYAAVAFGSAQEETFGGYAESSCTVTQRVVNIDTTSREVVPTNARYAYVQIQQPFGATNTVALGFGTAAVATSSFQLGTTTGNQAPDSMNFGLNADMPYTGAVNARASTASTSVLVTSCIY